MNAETRTALGLPADAADDAVMDAIAALRPASRFRGRTPGGARARRSTGTARSSRQAGTRLARLPARPARKGAARARPAPPLSPDPHRGAGSGRRAGRAGAGAEHGPERDP